MKQGYKNIIFLSFTFYKVVYLWWRRR